MKKATIFLFVYTILISSFSQGIIRNRFGGTFLNNIAYYFSASGNDANDGITPATPITINKIGSLTLRENDVFLFNKGDSFVLGDISISIGSIQIGCYGTGAQPKLLGSSDLSTATWVNNGDGTYYTSLASSPLWVYINGTSARNAESAMVTVTGTSGSTISGLQATLDAWNSTQSLIGAKLRCTEQNWVGSVEYTVSNYSAGTLTVGSTITANATHITNQFYLYQQKQWMTNANDWFYDASALRLYIKTAVSPTTMNIRQGIYNGLFSIPKRIIIDGLDISHYQSNTLDVSLSRGPIIKNCAIHDCRNHSIFATNTDDLYVYNNTITNMDGNGMVFCGTRNITIVNNTLSFVDYGLSKARKDYTGYPGWPVIGQGNAFITQGAITTGQGILILFSINPQIINNTIHHISNDAIQHTDGYSGLISQNYIHDYGTWWSDNGAIHTFGNNAQFLPISMNIIVSNNVIFNPVNATRSGQNAGIYFDGPNLTDNILNKAINNSVVTYTGTALIIVGGKNHTITGNNFIGTGNSIFRGTVDFYEPSLTGIIFTNNKVVTAASSATNSPCIAIANTSTPFTGGSTDNNQYVNPYNTTIGNSAFGPQTLSQWKTQWGMDASSTSRSNYITFSNASNATHECNIELNPANSIESFNTPAGYSDCQANPFSNPVNIAAFFSLIYLKNTSFP